MKKFVKIFLTLIVTIAMLGASLASNIAVIGGAVNTFAEETPETESNESENEDSLGSVDPAKVTTAIQNLTSALKDLKCEAKDISSFTKALTRLSGGTSLAAGGIAILQLLGIINDPTKVMLQNILTTLQQQNITLQELSKKIDDIAAELQKIEASMDIKARAAQARTYHGYWDSYTTNYLNVIEQNLKAYQGWVLVEVKNWAYENPHAKDLYVYYTMLDGAKTQTYSQKTDMNLAASESKETIIKDETFMLPKQYIDDALKNYRDNQSWNQNTFREDIVPLLSAAVKKAIGENKLGCSESFKTKWAAASPDDQNKMANDMADALLNQAVYLASVKGVGDHEAEANKLVTQVKQTLSMAMSSTSGIAAQIIPLQMTYCFEGETKDMINSAYQSMIAMFGYYVTFAATVASQSGTIFASDKDALINEWATITNKLQESNKHAITGEDSYCYVTGSRLTYNKYTIKGESRLTVKEHQPFSVERLTLVGRSAEKWKIINPSGGSEVTSLSMLSSSNALVLYMTWGNNRTDTKQTFAQYLNKNSTGMPSDFSNTLLTKYNGASEFSLNDGIRMVCLHKACRDAEPTHFVQGRQYNVMTDSDKAKYTVLHDKITGDTFNVSSGTLSANQLITARAHYWRGKSSWLRDEPWCFGYVGSVSTHRYWRRKDSYHIWNWDYCTNQDIYVLQCYPRKNDENYEVEEGEFDPFALVEKMATSEIVDVSYVAHAGEETMTKEDWDKFDFTSLYETETDEDLKEYIAEYIDELMAYYKNSETKVTISDEKKEALITESIKMIRNAEKELKNNSNINKAAYYDPFGLYGNDEKMLALAKAVLTDTEIATDGQTMEPLDNIITSAKYEPWINLTLTKSEDGYEIKPVLVYEVKPILVEHCCSSGEYKVFEISNDVMKEQELSMKIRFGASDAGKSNSALITHYDELYYMNVVESKETGIQGSGSNRYAEISVASCSPFTITYLTAVDTGDHSKAWLYIVLAVVALGTIAAATGTLRKKVKR